MSRQVQVFKRSFNKSDIIIGEQHVTATEDGRFVVSVGFVASGNSAEPEPYQLHFNAIDIYSQKFYATTPVYRACPSPPIEAVLCAYIVGGTWLVVSDFNYEENEFRQHFFELNFAGDHEFTAYGIGCATFTCECPEADVDNVGILDVHVGVGTTMIVILFECDGFLLWMGPFSKIPLMLTRRNVLKGRVCHHNEVDIPFGPFLWNNDATWGYFNYHPPFIMLDTIRCEKTDWVQKVQRDVAFAFPDTESCKSEHYGMTLVFSASDLKRPICSVLGCTITVGITMMIAFVEKLGQFLSNRPDWQEFCEEVMEELEDFKDWVCVKEKRVAILDTVQWRWQWIASFRDTFLRKVDVDVMFLNKDKIIIVRHERLDLPKFERDVCDSCQYCMPWESRRSMVCHAVCLLILLVGVIWWRKLWSEFAVPMATLVHFLGHRFCQHGWMALVAKLRHRPFSYRCVNGLEIAIIGFWVFIGNRPFFVYYAGIGVKEFYHRYPLALVIAYCFAYYAVRLAFDLLNWYCNRLEQTVTLTVEIHWKRDTVLSLFDSAWIAAGPKFNKSLPSILSWMNKR